MWSASSPNSNRQISYGVPNEVGMMGFRDMFVLAPAAATFQYGNQQHYQEPTLTFDHTNIPLLSASHAIQPSNIGLDEAVNNGTQCREIHFCQTQQHERPMMFPSTGGIGTSCNNKSITCRDCGNQAKKGCSFKRCRTCCKSRGFDCSTHVKSTWVPAARRRERQLLGSGDVVGSAVSSQSINSCSKKPKVIASQTTAATSHASTSNTTPPTSFESGSSHQAHDHRDIVDGKLFTAAGDGNYYNNEQLPGQVRAPAVFKCVRVTAMEDGDDEYAYQATVKIGGHVFKGFLYDQGVVADQANRDGIPNMSDLHLGGGGGRDGDSSSSPVNNMLHSSDVYGISGGHLFGGGVGGSSASYLCSSNALNFN